MISVRMDKAFVFGIDKRYKRLKDMRPVHLSALAEVYKWIQRNFQRKGQLAGGWAPLKPGTVKEKARIKKEKPLIRTGSMRMRWKPVLIGEDGAALRSIAEAGGLNYAKMHHEGTKHLPARPIIPTEEQISPTLRKVYRWHIKKSLKGGL